MQWINSITLHAGHSPFTLQKTSLASSSRPELWRGDSVWAFWGRRWSSWVMRWGPFEVLITSSRKQQAHIYMPSSDRVWLLMVTLKSLCPSWWLQIHMQVQTQHAQKERPATDDEPNGWCVVQASGNDNKNRKGSVAHVSGCDILFSLCIAQLLNMNLEPNRCKKANLCCWLWDRNYRCCLQAQPQPGTGTFPTGFAWHRNWHFFFFAVYRSAH